jgi:hypothetical protein
MAGRWLTALFCCWLSTPLTAQSLFDSLYERGDTVYIRLRTDFKFLVRHRSEKAYQTATVGIDGTEFSGRVRSRGHIRLEVCQLPSLKIKLKKAPLRKAGFSELNDLKLVLACADDRRGYGYLRREELAYRMYAILSPYHHRTVPVRIQFDDDRVVPGFLIEDEEQLAARYQASIIENESISTRGVDRSAYLDLCLFNYLILNTDWNIFNRHNVELILPPEAEKMIPIPYDFDYSGWVGTSYAIPDERRGIHSIYEPKFLGRHVTEAELTASAARWLPHRGHLRSLVSDYPELQRAIRRKLLRRLDEFYALLQDSKALAKLASD